MNLTYLEASIINYLANLTDGKTRMTLVVLLDIYGHVRQRNSCECGA